MNDEQLLAIDVGNSRIKAALLAASLPPPETLPAVTDAMAILSQTVSPAAVIGNWLDTKGVRPQSIFLGGVVPAVINSIRDDWRSEWGRITILERPASDTVVNRTDQPERVGPDRLFDAVAANRLRPPDGAAIVIDSGTATTGDVVDAEGVFLGGSILAGFELVASALHRRTALLPKIDPSDLSPPPEPLGSNTNAAIRSGLYWGLVGGVKELVWQLSQPSGAELYKAPLILLTGGAAPLLAPNLPAARLEPYLTLQGMVLAAGIDSGH